MRPALLGLAVMLAGGVLGCVEPPAVTLLALDTCAISPEGALCDDNEPCTVNDTCMAGICVGVVAADGTLCTDGDVCTFGDLCDKGVCIGTPAPDNFPCTDGNTCTMGDVCRASKCVAGPLMMCNDGIFCTTDLCVNGLGCQFTPIGDCSPPPEIPDAQLDLVSEAGDGMVVEVPPGDLVDRPGEAAETRDAPEVTEVPSEVAEVPPDSAGELAPEVRPEAGVDVPAESIPPGIDLRARGGACVCEAGGSGSPRRADLLVAALGLAIVVARRRRSS